MILNLISLSTVKTQLGISSGTTIYDAQITAMLPIVSSDIRRILNNRFDKYVTAVFSSANATIDFAYNGLSKEDPLYYKLLFELGQVVYHPNLPADTYLQSIDPLTGLFTLSATPTGSGTYIYPSVNISMFPAISKMVWYKIGKMNTTDSISKGIASESYGPVSISYTESEINKRYDYPNTLISDLGIPFARVG